MLPPLPRHHGITISLDLPYIFATETPMYGLLKNHTRREEHNIRNLRRVNGGLRSRGDYLAGFHLISGAQKP
jgi:hypothetical protein